MKPIFLFGTLLYEPLLTLVAGREVARVPAVLPGHSVCHVGEENYPRLRSGGGTARGVVIAGDDVRARIDFYEGGYDYFLRPVTVETDDGAVEAEVYWPGESVPAPGAPWDLQAWIEEWGAMTRHVAAEAMEYFGQISAAQLAARMPMIRARAWARVLAGKGEARPLLGAKPGQAPEIIAVRRPYSNFFSVQEADLRVPRFDGGLGPEVNRAAFIATDAAVVLPYDPVRDRVHLIEQFRISPLFRGDPETFLVEAIAGRVDGGEPPEAAARREAREEAGLDVKELHLVSSSYPTSGAFTEYLYIYVAIADLPDEAAGFGGLAEEHEDIRTHVIDYADFQRRLDSDELRVGPLVIAGHWLARHRAKLREEAQSEA